MHQRIRKSALMTVIVLTLFLLGQSADAALRDWLWPFGRQAPRDETPAAGAQTPPPGGTGTTQPPPPGGQPGQQPGAPGPVGAPPGPGTPPPGGQPGGQGVTGPGAPPPPGGQPGAQPGQPGPQPGGGRFFCNSLGREASKDECDAADAKRVGKPGEGREQSSPEGQRCESGKVPCPALDNRCVSPDECGRATPVCPPGEKPSGDKPCRIEESPKPPFPQGDQGAQPQPQPQPPAQPGPFPGKGSTEGVFPGKGATEGQFPGGPEEKKPEPRRDERRESPPPPPPFEEEPEHRPEVFISPHQVRDVLRQIRDQKREVTRLAKRAKKLSGGEALAAQADALLAQLSDTEQKVKTLKGEELQEAMQDFWDAQIWEEVNSLRSKIELPKQLKQMEKEIKRTEKLFKQKAFKRLTELGLNLEKMQADLASMRAAVENVRSLLASGSAEDAQEAMQEIFESGHPGEIGGVLHQMRGMTEGLRRVKNKEIRALILEVFQPVIDAVNEGDYREANQLLNELWPEMNRILPKLYNLRRGPDASLRRKLEAFESRIQEKLQSEGSEGGTNETAPSAPNEGF